MPGSPALDYMLNVYSLACTQVRTTGHTRFMTGPDAGAGGHAGPVTGRIPVDTRLPPRWQHNRNRGDAMINAELLRDEGILVVAPVDRLESADFAKLRLLVDPYLEAHDKLSGLLIYAKSFPGWDSFASLLSQLRFVRDNQNRIPRVVAVTDNSILAILPAVADHFTAAEVRHFDYRERDTA